VDIGKGVYKEVQVKYREDDPTFTARRFQPRDTFYVVCFLRAKHGDDFWIIPSRVFAEMGRPLRQGNREYVQLKIGRETSESYNALAKYHSNWGELLRGASSEIRNVVERASKRIEDAHFKQTDFEPLVLKMLVGKKDPVKTSEIVEQLETELKFSKADLTVGKGNVVRWKKTLQYALYHRMQDSQLIRLVGKGQWMITEKGVEWVGSYGP
jgi:hypothetical protein